MSAAGVATIAAVQLVRLLLFVLLLLLLVILAQLVLLQLVYISCSCCFRRCQLSCGCYLVCEAFVTVESVPKMSRRRETCYSSRCSCATADASAEKPHAAPTPTENVRSFVLMLLALHA